MRPTTRALTTVAAMAARTVASVAVSVVAAGVIGFAGADPTLAADDRPVVAVATLPQVIDNLRNWIVGILAGLATLFLTIGGLRYLMAGGDPGEVEKAKTALRSAAIGYGLAILAPIFVDILKGVVGA